MADTAAAVEIWRIEYSDATISELAGGISQELRALHIAVGEPAYKRPRNATLGTPEVIITILVTAATKAVIISGLHALQRYLEARVGSAEEKRLQVVLAGPDESKKRFPISLRQIGSDAVKEFISRIATSIDKL